MPLSQLADIHVATGASIIARRRQPAADFHSDEHSRARSRRLRRRCATALPREPMKLPTGYGVDWGGQFENLDARRNRLTLYPADHHRGDLRVTVLHVWFATYAGLVLMNVPFSLVGGIVFLWLRAESTSACPPPSGSSACLAWL